MTDLTPAEQAAAATIRGFDWADWGFDSVAGCLQEEPPTQAWTVDLARAVVAAVEEAAR